MSNSQAQDVNKMLASFDKVDVKITYVLGVMFKEGKINAQDKLYIKQGVMNNDQSFKMLTQLVKGNNNYDMIVGFINAFLESQRNEASQEQELDISPETIRIMNGENEDSSPTDQTLMHRKIKQQMQNDDHSPKFSLFS